jgi:hypothetical protein
MQDVIAGEPGVRVQARVRDPIATVGVDRMLFVDRPASPSLEAVVGGNLVGVLEIVNQPVSRIGIDGANVVAAS